jgi:hypothetical protein
MRHKIIAFAVTTFASLACFVETASAVRLRAR